MKRYNALVSFIVTIPENLPGAKVNAQGQRFINVFPPIIEGESDSVWVYAKTEKHADAIEAAERKLAGAYGIVGANMRVCDGFWHTTKG